MPKGRIASRHLADSLIGDGTHPGLFQGRSPTRPMTDHAQPTAAGTDPPIRDVWLAWKLWQALMLDRWLEKTTTRDEKTLPGTLMAAVGDTPVV